MKQIKSFEESYPVASPSLYQIVSSLFFALTAVSVKWFDGIPATQMICWRSIMTLLLISGLKLVIPHQSQSYPKKADTSNRLIWRGIIGSLGFITCFLSLKLVSVSEAVILQKTTPLWTTFIMVYILQKERINLRTLLEILFCLLGVILITKPAYITDLFDVPSTQSEMTLTYLIGLLLAIITAITSSLVQILIHSLSEEVSNLTILSYFYFFGIVTSCLFQLYSPYEEFKFVTFQEAILLIISGMFGCLGQLFMNRSMMLGDVTQQALIGQSQIIFNLLLDVFIVKQNISIMSRFGILVILSSLTSNLLKYKSN